MSKKRNDIITCSFCKTEHRRDNKSRHLKSKHCKPYQQANEILKDFVFNYKKSKSLEDKILTPYKNDEGEIIYLSKKQSKLLKNIKKIL